MGVALGGGDCTAASAALLQIRARDLQQIEDNQSKRERQDDSACSNRARAWAKKGNSKK